SNPTESFGIVLVEAMATGLPVVATNDAIRKEIVGDAGLFVDPTNADEYAKILEKALNTNWGDKPRNQAEKFSWDKIAKSYEEILENL
ncbi:MAG TPA: glycosyltransferase, partial [Patescibacteria group bacterium]|nr:glycosyltransferase [Patescibacteria group bacterium]